jgi:hypothetical protein
MKIIEVDCKVITLSGAILSSSLTLHNPHEFLAVMFEVIALQISSLAVMSS